jgi:hypothetical protein
MDDLNEWCDHPIGSRCKHACGAFLNAARCCSLHTHMLSRNDKNYAIHLVKRIKYRVF